MNELTYLSCGHALVNLRSVGKLITLEQYCLEKAAVYGSYADDKGKPAYIRIDINTGIVWESDYVEAGVMASDPQNDGGVWLKEGEFGPYYRDSYYMNTMAVQTMLVFLSHQVRDEDIERGLRANLGEQFKIRENYLGGWFVEKDGQHLQAGDIIKMVALSGVGE